MDNQKKQTSDHERLVRDWFQSEDTKVQMIVPVKIGKIKSGSFYAGFCEENLFILEVIEDRDVSLMEKFLWEDCENVMVNKGIMRVRVLLDEKADLSFPKHGDRVIDFLNKKKDLKLWEYERNIWSRMFGKQ
ncbi:hypothetical protein K8O68_02225 [Salipaludibacillus sp. CUR1]|uniref:hypothetical protein n=1 Tax=Salipaludibacillus sp. CUR1 TaxID=2820003 RepID=UPI001E39AD78|nr:hypothetical protein [Salipaludibacillus sp. CUR1]MCE7791235.1 hypothetical protein [Salipaludibacillus sp. CUR1]